MWNLCLKILAYSEIRVSFQVNSILSERGVKLIRNYITACNKKLLNGEPFRNIHPVTSALVVTSHPMMTYRRSLFFCSDPSNVDTVSPIPSPLQLGFDICRQRKLEPPVSIISIVLFRYISFINLCGPANREQQRKSTGPTVFL